MADMIEHSNVVWMHRLKQEWEDDITNEHEARVKAGLKERCMNCHKEIKTCECAGHTKGRVTTYWGL